MSDQPQAPGPLPETESGLVVVTQPGEQQRSSETVEQPAKVMRIGAMVRQLLEEVRLAPLDDAGRARLREIYELSVKELAEGLSPELREELAQFAVPFEADAPSEAELRVAQAQLVGWLEGLFHGIQATLFAQQMAARAQLEELQRKGLPPGPQQPGDRPGTYL
jgi:proteasome activator-like protein